VTPGDELGGHTTESFAALVAGERPVAVLLPVGSVEPHGPHLTLLADTIISEGAARRAVARLEAAGVAAVIAPAIPYGVTECAAGFPGAVSVPAAALEPFVRAVVDGYLAAGAAHVCVINNHLEPAQDRAVRAAVEGLGSRASVACPLTRRWGRTLSAEYKSGACHAGRYETSLVLACRPDLVDDQARRALPEVPISLSEKLGAGIETFREMGMDRAYAGAPAQASAAEGDELLERLGEMVATEVLEALGPGSSSG
jgi:creatinine amidohydrolase